MIADMEARIEQSNRRDRYIGAVRSLRDTLAYLREGQTVSTKQMRDSVVELLDALLDMETEGGTR
jgi:ribosomal protein L19E